MGNCYGPHPVNASIAYVNKVESDPYFQYEMFSVYEEKIFYPNLDGFVNHISYLKYPYEYALNYIASYQKNLASYEAF